MPLRVVAVLFVGSLRSDPNPHLGFGVGAPSHLGARLAKRKIWLAFEELVPLTWEFMVP